MTVRQDFPAQGPGSAPVAVLTTIDGTHQVPGARGDYPTCDGNCDIDMVREMLQFWRAHARLVSLWR